MAVPSAKILVNGVEVTKADNKGIYYINFDQTPGEYTIQAQHDYFIFDPLTVTVNEETRNLPDIRATATYVCGYVQTINREKDIYEKSLKSRTVRCLQEPNPLEEETWETPGIEDRLVAERTTVTNQDGEFCFTATHGLWRVTVDKTEDEEEGITWDYSSDRGSLAFIRETGVP